MKEYDGRKYTGMKVGRGHRWQYAAGEWVEKKVTPDQWEFRYAVNKQRHGKAPAGSGVPVGTAYHWYILADQTVTKLDANTYSTAMSGAKFKLAHKRADKETWSASERAQRKRLIAILEGMIEELRAEPEAGQQPGLAGQAGTAPATEAPAPATASRAAASKAAPSKAAPSKTAQSKAAGSARGNGNGKRPASKSASSSAKSDGADPALARPGRQARGRSVSGRAAA